MKKIKLLIITILLIAGNKVAGQIYDDFSDGNFSENPTWEGDTASFIINSQFQLQLNATDGSTATIAVDGSFLGEEMEWRMAVKLAFAPSGSNFARIYLAGDSADTSSIIHKGYFLQFGEAGSNDVMELFYGEDENVESICRGRTSIASSFYYNIKVTKSADNLWTIYCDSLRNGLYVEECSGYGRDEPPFSGGFSVYCKFTSGNRTKFTFDDFYLGPPLIDTMPPEITNFVFQHPDIVKITFSETMNDSSVLSPLNYLILEDNQTPALCEFEGEDLQSVTLYFAESLRERQNYHLSIRNATDLAGNPMSDTIFSLFYCLPKRNEVLITEIMADPTPAVQLPECEYIELHNTLEYNIILKNWQLQIGNNRRSLPEISMTPHGYITVIAESSLALFPEDEAVATVSSLSLTDDGQRLVLLNESDDVIHTVNYSKNWHTNALKRDGGWALEMIDIENPCAGGENWNSSENELGGTPGRTNSITDENPDYEPPIISKVTVPDAQHVRVFFSESILKDSTDLQNIFLIDRGLSIVSGNLEPPAFNTLVLTLSDSLRRRITYTLTMAESVCDCVGNQSGTASVFFGLPEVAEEGDIIINEVLSDPIGDSDGDYVELYNNSDKLLDLSDLLIGIGNGEVPTSVAKVVEDGYQLFPQCYAAICKNKRLTTEQYPMHFPGGMVENIHLPAYPNEGGCVHLMDDGFRHIDRFCYDKSMHYPLLLSTDGVALERIHIAGKTQDANNWKSAAESHGWGTPGGRNSQFAEGESESEGIIVSPDIFSPDGDGFNDFTEIDCHFSNSENRVTIEIYDDRGIRVKQLVSNQICGRDERFRWDGLTDDNRAVNHGLYLIVIQLWNTNGNRKTIRKSVGVTQRK